MTLRTSSMKLGEIYVILVHFAATERSVTSKSGLCRGSGTDA